MRGNSKRVCKFCGEEFMVMNWAPYYSCAKCRGKELWERKLTIQECRMCGNKFSTTSLTEYCRECRAKIRHTNQADSKCKKCGTPITSSVYGDYCRICKMDTTLNAAQTICIFCGKPTLKGAVCRHCKDEAKKGICHKLCLNCKRVYTDDISATPVFCSSICEQEWTSKHHVAPAKTTEELTAEIKNLLLANPMYTTRDIVRTIGISSGSLTRRGIVVTTIRNELQLPHPKKKVSLFEQDVEKILEEMGFAYEREKTFNDLKFVRHLRFDFYIPELNLLLEADGAQHYNAEARAHFANGDTLQARDTLKNEYAIRHGISILRVQYFRYYESAKLKRFKALMQHLRCAYQETGKLKFFNCWNGSELIPISSQSSSEAGSQTIPEGSTSKRMEMGTTLTSNVEGNDIVEAAGNT